VSILNVDVILRRHSHIILGGFLVDDTGSITSGGTCNGKDGSLRLDNCELKALPMTMYATSVKVQRNLVVRSVG